MSNEKERKCVKCNKVLKSNEGYCSSCGKLSCTPPKGTFTFRLNKVLPLGISFIILGLIIIICILVFNMIDLAFGPEFLGRLLITLGLALLVLGAIAVYKCREINKLLKRECKHDIHTLNCKYCNAPLPVESNFCHRCGSKIQ